jgi:hypothetical protein
MQGAQKLRSEVHLQVRRNDEVTAQRRRWTFYETINFYSQFISPAFPFPMKTEARLGKMPSFLRKRESRVLKLLL